MWTTQEPTTKSTQTSPYVLIFSTRCRMFIWSSFSDIWQWAVKSRLRLCWGTDFFLLKGVNRSTGFFLKAPPGEDPRRVNWRELAFFALRWKNGIWVKVELGFDPREWDDQSRGLVRFKRRLYGWYGNGKFSPDFCFRWLDHNDLTVVPKDALEKLKHLEFLYVECIFPFVKLFYFDFSVFYSKLGRPWQIL